MAIVRSGKSVLSSVRWQHLLDRQHVLELSPLERPNNRIGQQFEEQSRGEHTKVAFQRKLELTNCSCVCQRNIDGTAL